MNKNVELLMHISLYDEWLYNIYGKHMKLSTGVDPGFPVRGANPCWGAPTQALFGENISKMKELVPVERGYRNFLYVDPPLH